MMDWPIRVSVARITLLFLFCAAITQIWSACRDFHECENARECLPSEQCYNGYCVAQFPRGVDGVGVDGVGVDGANEIGSDVGGEDVINTDNEGSLDVLDDLDTSLEDVRLDSPTDPLGDPDNGVGIDSADGDSFVCVEGFRCTSRMIERCDTASGEWIVDQVCERDEECIDGFCVDLPVGFELPCDGPTDCPDEALFCFEEYCVTRVDSDEGDECLGDRECSGDLLCTRTGYCQLGEEDDPCIEDEDCDLGADLLCGPDTVCQTGTAGDSCISRDDCQPELLCGPFGCSAGAVGDWCAGDHHCAGVLLCGPTDQCQSGTEPDPCGSESDCLSPNYQCIDEVDACYDGSFDDPCDNDEDCAGELLCGATNRCQIGSELDPCDNDDDCLEPDYHCVEGTNACYDGTEGDECDSHTDCHENSPMCSPTLGCRDGFSLIEAGTFWMGSPDGCPGPGGYPGTCELELGYMWVETLHQVTLTRPFFVQTTETTQQQWHAVMGSNPAYFSVAGEGDNCGIDSPVEMVSWWDVICYLNQLSESEELEQCYTLTTCNGTPGSGCDSGHSCTGDYSCQSVTFTGLDCTGYRLPAEAEWEYATRAGTTTAFYNGTNSYGFMSCENEPNLDLIGWYCDNSEDSTHPVATLDDNDWGLYDMSGNVAEWGWDWFDAEYYSGSPDSDPLGDDDGTSRVLRGGHWAYFPPAARSAMRLSSPPTNRSYVVGFRVVRTATP